MPPLQRALSAWRTDEVPIGDALRWLWLATHAAHDVWDDESWEVLCTRHLRGDRRGLWRSCRSHSAPGWGCTSSRVSSPRRPRLVDEFETVNEVMDKDLLPYGALALAAWRGRQDIASELIRTTFAGAGERGEGMGLSIVDYSSAVLYNSVGQYYEALAAAERGAGYQPELGFATWSLVELVEAAMRSDHPDRAADALELLARTTNASGTEWALGMRPVVRAQVAPDDAAEGFHVEAIDRLGRCRMRAELARAHLLYGEWLRREHRRLDARSQLTSAYDMFSDMGADAFAERARRELLAAGVTVRTRTFAAREDFTSQEAQVARLAAEGRTNPEIGAELFLSPRTVEWHLGKVFAKLGIESRKEISEALLNT